MVSEGAFGKGMPSLLLLPFHSNIFGISILFHNLPIVSHYVSHEYLIDFRYDFKLFRFDAFDILPRPLIYASLPSNTLGVYVVLGSKSMEIKCTKISGRKN